MPKPRKKEEFKCRYFRWLLGTRNDVYLADGRANTPPLGRHSLGTKDETEARELIHELDLSMAVKYGKADKKLLQHTREQYLTLDDGREIYEKHVHRPQIAKRPRESTAKRYRAVFDKFIPFAQSTSIKFFNEIDSAVLDDYADFLEGAEYAYATIYLEMNTIKQVLKYLVAQKHLPPACLFTYPMEKDSESNTYCWTPEQVDAMLKLCQKKRMDWLSILLTCLVTTGLRIRELADLRWNDIDLSSGTLMLADETKRRIPNRAKRRTKSGESRSFPIHDDLLVVLQEIERASDGYVFHGPKGGRIKPDTIRTIFIREILIPLEKCFPSVPDEIGFKDGRLHSFRHYFCSACSNSGVPEQVLMRWLGHKNSRMVKRYYHLHDEESKRQMQRINILGNSNSDSNGEAEA